VVLIVLSICVPAVGAALHGIRTQSEFRRHAQRYQRMAVLLRQLEADLSRAQSIEWIHEIAADAERVMRAENSDWFGVMRFHDVELITLRDQSAPAARPARRLAGNIYGTACALSGEGPHAKAVTLHGLMLRSAGHRGACSRSECAQPGVRSENVFLRVRGHDDFAQTALDLGGPFRIFRAEAGMDTIFRPTDVIRA
jgi:hypothetical protein